MDFRYSIDHLNGRSYRLINFWQADGIGGVNGIEREALILSDLRIQFSESVAGLARIESEGLFGTARFRLGKLDGEIGLYSLLHRRKPGLGADQEFAVIGALFTFLEADSNSVCGLSPRALRAIRQIGDAGELSGGETCRVFEPIEKHASSVLSPEYLAVGDEGRNAENACC